MRRAFPVLLATVALAAAATTTPATAAASDRAAFARWTSGPQLTTGTLVNARVTGQSVILSRGTTGSWTSPWRSTGFSARRLVPSWSVSTPAGSWAVVQVRVRSGSSIGSWDTLATWALGTDKVKRASGSSQTDDLSRISTDTVLANGSRTFSGWQVRVTLRRSSASGTAPVLGAVNGVASSYSTRAVGTSTTTMTKTVELGVPRYSQMIHRSHHRQYDGGGAAWCSPTSTSMVLRYFKAGPTAAQYAWTKESNGHVDHGARYSYDHRYQGTGNWAFNTAYAARYGSDAFVTRLYSLREAEAFIKAGIPLVASVAFGRGGLTGAPLTATPGHLMVIRGFAKSGAVIANDPAASKDSTVRRIYQRGQFERAWLRGSGGIVYVIRPTSKALPADTARW